MIDNQNTPLPALNDFPALLAACIQASGLTQREVARRAGISPQQLSRYLAGGKEPLASRWLALLLATGTKVAVYLPGEPVPEGGEPESELARFRQWAEENYGGGYHDMVWKEWEKYHSGK